MVTVSIASMAVPVGLARDTKSSAGHASTKPYESTSPTECQSPTNNNHYNDPQTPLTQKIGQPPLADITYIRTWQGWLYLAVVIDVFSRRVVGWSMRDDLKTDIVVEALQMAIAFRKPDDGLVHHSDQGTQYTSIAFGSHLRNHKIAASMGSVADCYDNAVAEAFWASLKTELIYQRSWPTREEARLAIFDWIETWYNPHRRHSTNGQLSPHAYEQAHKAA